MNAPSPNAPSFQALTGGFANPALDSARAFRTIMQVMARPGRIDDLNGAEAPAPLSIAAGTLALVLLDQTTPLFLAPSHDTPLLRSWISFHTGAPFAAPEAAMFAIGDWDALQPITRFAIGTPEYPDRAATLIVEVPALANHGAHLSGPGIRDHAHLSLPDIAPLQANRAQFPLGLDLFLTCDQQVAGLPRSTTVEEG